MEVPTVVSYSSPQQRTTKQTIDVPVPHGRVDRGGGEGLPGLRPGQNSAARGGAVRTLAFQFLMVVVDGLVMEAFKVSPWDRIQQRFEEQITLTLQFFRVVAAFEVLKVSSRVLLVLHPRTRLVPWMFFFFSHFFPRLNKSARLGPH